MIDEACDNGSVHPFSGRLSMPPSAPSPLAHCPFVPKVVRAWPLAPPLRSIASVLNVVEKHVQSGRIRLFSLDEGLRDALAEAVQLEQDAPTTRSELDETLAAVMASPEIPPAERDRLTAWVALHAMAHPLFWWDALHALFRGSCDHAQISCGDIYDRPDLAATIDDPAFDQTLRIVLAALADSSRALSSIASKSLKHKYGALGVKIVTCLDSRLDPFSAQSVRTLLSDTLILLADQGALGSRAWDETHRALSTVDRVLLAAAASVSSQDQSARSPQPSGTTRSRRM